MQDETKETHESYGVVTMVRTVGGHGRLFDSPLDHDSRIRIEIRGATVWRRPGEERIQPDMLPLASFEMSEIQFARFITSAGQGEGTPITLLWRPFKKQDGTYEHRRAADVPVSHKGDMFKKDIEEARKKAAGGIVKLKEQIDGVLLKKGPLTMDERKQIAEDLRVVVKQVNETIPWIVTMFNEKMVKEVQHAKGEIEAFLNVKAQQIGFKKIAESVQAHSPMGFLSDGNPSED